MKKWMTFSLLVVLTATMAGCFGTEPDTMPSKESSKMIDGQQTQTQSSTTQSSPASQSPKPDPAAVADGKYETKLLFSEQLEILIPKEFKDKSSKTGEVIYKDKSEEVTIRIHHDPGQSTTDRDVDKRLLQKLTAIMEQNYTDAKLLREEVIKVNGRQLIVVEADSKDKYALRSWGLLNGEFLEIEITCPVKKKTEWQAVANDIVNSIKMK
ncbi:hypothetical protein P4H70_21260 [Paenibacillus ehimensis]|uniref:hypothetical protein n=1 Tax=Paenibacillus ehimensis TaxID=79264 RepID=UPI002DB6D1FC|nr:hypothetical protein [Paenibacillus ehimensis]MEC0211471.1 hypothetical protein [Paenibacillus ehimensis]